MEEGSRKSQVYRQIDSLAPKRLLYQIILLQVIYYLIGGILISFYYLVSGNPFDFMVVFSWEPVRRDTTIGWTLAMLWLLDTFFSVLAMTIIVGRSKLALDFTLTLHGINILVAWIVSGEFPSSLLWWGVQGLSVILMVTLGTWTSQWRELRTTFFDLEGSGERTRTNNNQTYEMVDNPSHLNESPQVGVEQNEPDNEDQGNSKAV